MLIQALLVVFAFILTLVFTPVCRNLCLRAGWVDKPDSRKLHRKPIPRSGGVAIMLGYAVALIVVRLAPVGAFTTVDWSSISLRALLPAILVAFGTGLLDDIFNLRPWMKFSGQILAAWLATQAHVLIHGIAGYSVVDSWWSIPLTMVWLVACSNAFNLIDGLDGLATGIGLFATATALLTAILSGNGGLALLTAPLLGALLGFLRYNFNPASIFMGDSGSLTVGFLLGCFGVVWSEKSATLLGMTAPLIAMAIPLLDTTLAIARRFLRGQHIFAADRGHIHHRLLARGFTPRRVAYTLYAFAGLMASLSLLMNDVHFAGGVVVAFCAVVWLAVRYLGYEEFDVARRMVAGGFFRHILSANLAVTRFEQAVHGAGSVEGCWEALLEAGRTFGLSVVTLRLRDREFSATLIECVPSECWFFNIPLDEAGEVSLSAPFGANHDAPPTVAPLARSLRAVLAPRLRHLQTAGTVPVPRRRAVGAEA